MKERVIEARNLGLRFSKNPHRVLSFQDMYLKLFGRNHAPENNGHWWVLKDINFSVESGDILAVIGKNGAGKSTLLRVLAGIMPPDEGSLDIKGRTLLLSPGLGFREDLSGRDNIFYGGLFLGLTRREIVARTDEVIDFAELRDAIDRPFKYYSDGMKARLIFSLATSVDPDILMLDELLGAGDASFQEKAKKRMDELIAKARSIILVTHNMGFVQKRCTRALYLDQYRARFLGDPKEAVDLYMKDLQLPTPGTGM